jgi:hypothetical protein
MAGEYDLIGRNADSTLTCTGYGTLRDEGGALSPIHKLKAMGCEKLLLISRSKFSMLRSG